MSRILHFTAGPSDWQSLLADPVKHWRTGYSARTLAYSWEAAEGFPPEVATTLATSTDPLFAGIQPLLAVPEFKVPLPGGERPSQNDIFVLARATSGPITIMVEGKVNESFGPTLEDWLSEVSPGKKTRLSFLLRTLALPKEVDSAIRYQLLHRTASALIEGERFRASAALLLVHSFSPKKAGWSDYCKFLSLFGVTAEMGTVQRLPGQRVVPLFAAWVPGDAKFLGS